MSFSKSKILRLKILLKSEFDMKELGNAKKSLGMAINRNRKENILTISQETYSHKVITKFGMKEAKSVNVPLAAHMNLSSVQCPKTEAEFKDMKNIPYANVIRSVVFFMVTTRPDLAYYAHV